MSSRGCAYGECLKRKIIYSGGCAYKDCLKGEMMSDEGCSYGECLKGGNDVLWVMCLWRMFEEGK